ncbi:MAG: C13 family peptidase, partial [Myxococcota bacterium]
MSHCPKSIFLPAAMLLLASLAAFSCAGDGPLNVGVIVPVDGTSMKDWRESLEWARANIEKAGGVGGRELRLVYSDRPGESALDIAKRFAEDPSIVAAIGPDTSGDFFKAAALFVKMNKVIISPSATSSDIFSAYGGKKYVWRTVQSDVAQLKTMLLLGLKSGGRKIALVASDDRYGATFFDTFGFFANDLGLKITSMMKLDMSLQDCSGQVGAALAGNPDVLFIVPSTPEEAACVVRAARAISPSTALFLSDGGRFQQLIDLLCGTAEGLEGTSVAADPQSGFEIASKVILGHSQAAFAASTYDALLLIAYGLERSGGHGGQRLADAIAGVVDARGAKTGWDDDGIRETLKAIRSGVLPDITGASGPLDYDLTMHTDPTVSIYGHWRVEAGEFLEVGFVTTGDSNRAASLASSYASERSKQEINIWDPSRYTPEGRTGLWALVAATSSGWSNYRHQAGALSQYQLLKSRGVPDSRIVLIPADDIAQNPQNPEPGVIRNIADGPDVYTGAVIDYRLSGIDSTDIMDILAGKRSDRLPTVIESSAGDDIFVYIVDHGDPANGILVGDGSGRSSIT